MFTLPETEVFQKIRQKHTFNSWKRSYINPYWSWELRFSFATLEDYTATVRHFMRSGVAGVIVAICVLSALWYDGTGQLDLGISGLSQKTKASNLGEWMSVQRPAIVRTPKNVSGIVGFILFANLALLNLLTAIMVEAVVDILRLDSIADSTLCHALSRQCSAHSWWVPVHDKRRDDEHRHLFDPVW